QTLTQHTTHSGVVLCLLPLSLAILPFALLSSSSLAFSLALGTACCLRTAGTRCPGRPSRFCARCLCARCLRTTRSACCLGLGSRGCCFSSGQDVVDRPAWVLQCDGAGCEEPDCGGDELHVDLKLVCEIVMIVYKGVKVLF
ncbi:hypothetical protein F5883DRAFT_160187, partial [Diaporthe sp. PMI_573]